MRPLADAGHRVIALDLPGFGESERPGRVKYFASDQPFYARFVLDAMDVLGLERVHLGGQSMGGSIALITAVTAPERIRSLILVAPAGFGREVGLYLRLCSLPGMGLLARLPAPRRAVHESLRSCFYDVSRISAELYDEAVRYGGPSFREFVRALGQGLDLRGVRKALRESWYAHASRYRGPVLVAWGKEDRVLPVSQLDEMRALLPQLEAHVLDRCGHLAMTECPDEFLSATLPFLARVEHAVAA
jgi:pimeloyl-ACP methyl ester carboxylesterase